MGRVMTTTPADSLADPLAELVAQLAPAHAPPPPGWWPPAPGWWMLAALLLIALVLLVLYLRSPARRLRRAALAELRQLESAHSGEDPALAQALAPALENLLRRFALARFGREPVSRLSGETWIAFLVAHGGAAWGGTAGPEFLRAAYGGSVVVDRARWVAGARNFIRKARPGRGA